MEIGVIYFYTASILEWIPLLQSEKIQKDYPR